jgi:hypothetical protein
VAVARARSPARSAVGRPLPSDAVSPFWIWMQVAIVVCVLAGFVIAIVKLV